MKPLHSIILLFLIFFLLAMLMAFFPKEGIPITNDFKLQFITYDEFTADPKAEQADISTILKTSQVFAESEKEELADTLQSVDSLKVNKKVEAVLFPLQFPNNDRSVLHHFFAKLQNLRAGNELIRILHYGDSQIEADRITSFIRNKMQKKFGGSGIGLFPAKQAFNYQGSLRHSISGSWKRYPVFGKRDTTLTHKRFGVLGAFSRFAPLRADTLEPAEYQGVVSFKESSIAYYSVRKFNQCRLFYGYNKSTVQVETYINDQLYQTDSLPANTQLSVKKWRFEAPVSNLEFHFKGSDSPDFYAFALDNSRGIAVDNIAWRGNSGTSFTKMDANLLAKMYNELNVEMMFLQFGGNVTPYIKDNYKGYGRWFYSQLALLKRLRPNLAIVVIGPADMSRKVKEKYESYPNIGKIRDALREATFKAGGAYWDMYEAMGGKNSMPAWVNNVPSLAEKDYIHFNYKGAKVIAEMFYKALMHEYDDFVNQKANPKKKKQQLDSPNIPKKYSIKP